MFRRQCNRQTKSAWACELTNDPVGLRVSLLTVLTSSRRGSWGPSERHLLRFGSPQRGEVIVTAQLLKLEA